MSGEMQEKSREELLEEIRAYESDLKNEMAGTAKLEKEVAELKQKLAEQGLKTVHANMNGIDLHEQLSSLQSEIKRKGEQLDALLNHCDKEGGECSECSKIICPQKDEMHFHHDGCPSCEQALAKEGE